MSTKLICYISLILLITQAGNAGEVARWDFEETGGATAADQSGLYIATLAGSDTLDVDGKFGSGIDFAGDGGATMDGTSSEAFRFTGDFSIAFWVTSDVAWGAHTRFVDISAADGGLQDSYRLFTHSGADIDNFKFMSRQDGSNTLNIHTRDMAVETWILLVLRNDLDGSVTMNVLQDGDTVDTGFVAANSESWPTAGPIVHADGELKLGRLIGGGRKFDGKMDGLAFYDELLTDAEIADIFNRPPSSEPIAVGPKPDDGTLDVLRDVGLSWTPGQLAATHDVYFGTSFEDVNSAVVATSSGLVVTSFDPGRLEFGTTYFWRVDEVNGTPDNTVFKGGVWSFEVEPYSIKLPSEAITVSASSFNNDTTEPNRTIDGSGLDNPNDGNALHSAEVENVMWMSASGDVSPWLMYEFEGAYKLDKLLIWNSNHPSEAVIGWGIKDVDFQVSMDGINWTSIPDVGPITQGPGLAPSEAQAIDTGSALARYVKLNILTSWGGLLPQYAVAEVQFYSLPTMARTPVPASGSTDILPKTTVSWRAGREVSQHTVHVSSDMNALADGTAPSASSVTNSLDLTSLDLQLDEAYYWRVDEVNDAEVPSVWTGPAWSFSTVPYLTVEDFESYGNVSPDRPFQTWLDGIGYSADEFFPVAYEGNGTGAGIGHDIWSVSSPHFDGTIMETINTMAGSGQSMPFYFTNTGGVTSQTERSFAIPQDWTVGGAKTLSIGFSGQAGNKGTPYIKINNTKVAYDGDPENMTLGVWQAWNIDLSSMDVQNVTTVQFGVEGAGAAGMFLIDDIRLHPKAGERITPVDPGNDNLVAAWDFNEGSGTVVADNSGNGRVGTIVGATWDTGHQGSALLFDEMAYVETGYAGITGTGSRTCCAWIKTVEPDRGFLSWGLNTVGNKWRMRLDATGGLRIEVNGGSHYGQAFLADDEWHHTAVVLEDDGTPDCSETLLYVDGLPETTRAISDEPIDTDPTGEVRIGKSTYDTFGFIGLIDDVRVYDRALSDAEVRSLAGRTTSIDKPL